MRTKIHTRISFSEPLILGSESPKAIFNRKVNFEIFVRAGRRVPAKDIVEMPEDPEENNRQVASYHAAGPKVGPSWKMSYWNHQQLDIDMPRGSVPAQSMGSAMLLRDRGLSINKV
eukprot:COSAG01_NODE_14395_length_1459_cov_45.384559_1_plen_115_part_10